METKNEILGSQLNYLAEQARKSTGAKTALVVVNFDGEAAVGIGHMPNNGQGKEGTDARAQMIITLCRVADMICEYQQSGVRVVLRTADGAEFCDWGTPTIQSFEGEILDIGLGHK